MDLNKIIIVGRLTAQPELKEVNGNKLCNFVIANNQRNDQVNFIDCTAWGKTAEIICQYCNKGSQVAVEGRLHQDRWHDENNKLHSRLKVMIDSIQFLGGKNV